ncbi:hypothetical protein BON22_5460 [Cyberlindnera fabianii]|uniref:Uncharacterized protein n=1 Tax=Cyberlindnera fabianii TaxID=36022 RepID=A0A1V2KYH5_CYBFA|nr:hypothetical protein BON22_5460 [Cyberlindnera fabianii]
MDTEESVDDFLLRVQQLDKDRKREDSNRRQRLKDEILSMSMRSKPSSSSTKTYSPPRATIPQSESIKHFNASVSREYRLNLDELVYESAYNYDKSRNKENQRPRQNTKVKQIDLSDNDDHQDDDNDEEERRIRESFRASKSQSYKKYDDLDIVRFDDFVSKRDNKVPTSARYSKFELSDDQKREMDQTLYSLIGGSIPSLDDKESLRWSSAAKSKPSVPLPSAQMKRSPRKMDLETPTRAHNLSRSSSPIKRSPGKIDIHSHTRSSPDQYDNDDEESLRPALPSRPSLGKSSEDSSRPPLPTRPSDKSYSPKPKPPVRPKSTWLESTLKNSTTSSTPQALNTTANYAITKPSSQKSNGHDGHNSWLESAKKVTSSKPFEQPKPKIAPIVPSKSNTLTHMMEKDALSKSQREKTLEELANAKLNHTSKPEPPKTTGKLSKDEPRFNSLPLKKTRAPVPPAHSPSPSTRETSPELVNVKLKPAVPARKPSLEVPEALKKSQTLRPASPTRKVSEDVPEALKKSGRLKPAVPTRKASEKLPEALTKVGSLKMAKPLPEKERVVPEALKKTKELKPAPPKRKVSQKQLEALQALGQLRKSEKPEVKPKPRKVSESKDVLNKSLQGLKSIKEQSPSSPSAASDTPLDKKAMLENVLKRAQTAPTPHLMMREEDLPTQSLKKASTFDNSSTASANDSLTHPNKSRAKGPKRRAPKSTGASSS